MVEADPMSKFAIEVQSAWSGRDYPSDLLSLWVEPRIDGEPLWNDQKAIGCLVALESASEDGSFRLLNCDCGVFECGGYYKGVLVEHLVGGRVRWTDLDRPAHPPVELRSVEVADAVRAARSQLLEQVKAQRHQPLQFICGDDAGLLGLDWRPYSLSKAAQAAMAAPKGILRRSLFSQWFDVYLAQLPTWWDEACLAAGHEVRALLSPEAERILDERVVESIREFAQSH
jgi:hypothetical protein